MSALTDIYQHDLGVQDQTPVKRMQFTGKHLKKGGGLQAQWSNGSSPRAHDVDTRERIAKYEARMGQLEQATLTLGTQEAGTFTQETHDDLAVVEEIMDKGEQNILGQYQQNSADRNAPLDSPGNRGSRHAADGPQPCLMKNVDSLESSEFYADQEEAMPNSAVFGKDKAEDDDEVIQEKDEQQLKQTKNTGDSFIKESSKE